MEIKENEELIMWRWNELMPIKMHEGGIWRMSVELNFGNKDTIQKPEFAERR